MGSYLDAYGAAGERSEQRAKLIKRIVVAVLAVSLIATVAYYSLRMRSQEQVVNQFLQALQSKDYVGAYKLWGCTSQTPCKDYPFTRFNEDWGAASPYVNAAALKIEHVDFCDSGVVFSMTYPKQDTVGLWVDRSTNVIGFAPWTRCPGRHLALGDFFKSLFS